MRAKKEQILRSLEAGRGLADWMNSSQAARHPVRKAILEMLELNRFARMSDWEDPDYAVESRRTMETRAAKVRRVTRKYAFFFNPIPQAHGIFVAPVPLQKSPLDRAGCFALADWKTLGDAYAQWRLRRCKQCEIFFCASRRDHRFHDRLCEDEYNKHSNPKYVEKRREYARDRYRQELERSKDPELEEKLAKLDAKRARKAEREHARIQAAARKMLEEMREESRQGGGRKISKGGRHGNL
jgi:hypothetical protein